MANQQQGKFWESFLELSNISSTRVINQGLKYSSAPGNERFSPPNPVRLQNKLLIAAGAVFLILGVVLIFMVRGSAAQGNADAFGGILVSVGMIAVGVGALA